MDEKKKKILLGIIYTVVLFGFFYYNFEDISNKIMREYVVPPSTTDSMDSIWDAIPFFAGRIISFAIALLLAIIIVRYVTIARINYFLKPTTFKVISTIFISIIIYIILFINNKIDIISGSIERLISLNSMVFPPSLWIIELITRLLGYYVIMCFIYKYALRNK